MNKARRQEIARAIAMIADARDILDQVREDEQDAFDNMPESLQESERGQQMSEALDSLEEATGSLEEVEGSLDELTDGETAPAKTPAKTLAKAAGSSAAAYKALRTRCEKELAAVKRPGLLSPAAERKAKELEAKIAHYTQLIKTA